MLLVGKGKRKDGKGEKKEERKHSETRGRKIPAPKYWDLDLEENTNNKNVSYSVLYHQ